MIYDVKSDYFQSFLSTKQGTGHMKGSKGAGVGGGKISNGDAMDTD